MQVIAVRRAGMCDLVVDLGRPGFGHLGVPRGGAADPCAMAVANRLVGNDVAAAGLEIIGAGPALLFPSGGVAALTGSRFAASRDNGAAVPWNETLVLDAGETLDLGKALEGFRCWLALRGGVAVPQVMGSRSTFLPAGFGGQRGRALRAGDNLTLGAAAGELRRLCASPPLTERTRLRVVTGPQVGRFDDAGLAAFFARTYRVEAASDRRGLRLRGAAVTSARTDMRSQGVLPGAVQVPPDGQPIILGWDGPVTGGYPVIAGVITADWPLLAQLKPNDEVRFATVELEEAQTLAATDCEIGELS